MVQSGEHNGVESCAWEKNAGAIFQGLFLTIAYLAIFKTEPVETWTNPETEWVNVVIEETKALDCQRLAVIKKREKATADFALTAASGKWELVRQS